MNPASIDAARASKEKAVKIFGRIGVVVGVGITRIDDSSYSWPKARSASR